MASRLAPTTCPVCSGALTIARLGCTSCGTALEGDFTAGRLGRLSREQQSFVEVFLECRGKIKDVEQRLGISYPTVVSRLDQVVQALGAPIDPRGSHIDEVLESLARGDLTPEEAAKRLKGERR
ncbi:MAG: DUF2089 domain-containing protein [Myxococcales bacterium]|nr:DUF2089 domain-containing protein [Myxococcales bacterium]MCB9582477.1 DUF2089 domain-containing protein [Polyangiaceae bacterium]